VARGNLKHFVLLLGQHLDALVLCRVEVVRYVLTKGLKCYGRLIFDKGGLFGPEGLLGARLRGRRGVKLAEVLVFVFDVRNLLVGHLGDKVDFEGARAAVRDVGGALLLFKVGLHN
jgi:hypothetical protein